MHNNQRSDNNWRTAENPFRYRLKALRLNLGLTQLELGAQLKISKASIGAYEEGRSEPSITQLKKFARFFSVTVDQLVGFK